MMCQMRISCFRHDVGTSNLTLIEIGSTCTQVVMCRTRISHFRQDVSGERIQLNLLSTNVSLDLFVRSTNYPSLRRRVPRDGMRVIPEGHPEVIAPGPVCPRDIWTMQLRIKSVSIDLLIVLSVQDNSGVVDEELVCSESTLPVQVAPLI